MLLLLLLWSRIGAGQGCAGRLGADWGAAQLDWAALARHLEAGTL